MTANQEHFQDIPLFIAQSSITTEINKTGTWRFVRPEYDEKTAPCSAACPAGEDMARIEMLASRGEWQEAWETILRENPFPATCGRVCFHPCEGACNRAEMDNGIAIHHLERFLGDMAIAENFQVPKTVTSTQRTENKNQRIAIAGAGPAGLAAAFFLSRLGYSCEVFEAQPEPGGILRWGIPQYRLPPDVLNAEIARIIGQGVRIHCQTPVTRDFLDEISHKYDAVFMGCGHGTSLRLQIPGQELAQDGLAFLHKMRNDESVPVRKNETAAIIGGGNTAVDVARSLVRMGVKPVLIYRRRKQDMPAFAHEVEMAFSEGVEMRELASPVRIEEKNGKYLLFLQKMKPLTKDSGTQVVPDGDTIESVEFSQIFTAIGAAPSENWLLPPESGDTVLQLSHCTLVRPQTGLDNTSCLVSGGDLTNPVKSVADAIASGKQAAMALDTLFQNQWHEIEEKLRNCRVGKGSALSLEMYLDGSRKNRNPHTVAFEDINTDYFETLPSLPVHTLSPDERIRSFCEIEQTLPPDEAVYESRRCFNCGICNHCDNCRIFCPEIAVMVNTADTMLHRQINLEYCKGCGICVAECPRSAMSLKEEK